MFKKGDTLVEVMLAIGIFSMIAIAVTAVMSSGSSGAQTSLETTLTREEIDTQAEAIRFIQASYAINKNSADDTYTKLWKEIIKNPAPATEEILQYAPSSCEDIYDDNISNYAFIINPRALSTFSADGSPTAIIRMKDNIGAGRMFHQTLTHPRLVFGEADTGNLLTNPGDNLTAAEGLYVIAVRDDGTSYVYDAAGDDSREQGFYDFFIRSCWYGTDADVPTTISTVIRLYDPDAITPAGFITVKYDGMTDENLNPDGFDYNAVVPSNGESSGRRVTLPKVTPREGWEFVWKVTRSSHPDVYSEGHTFNSGAPVINNQKPNDTVEITVKGEWQHIHYKIKYVTDPNPVTGVYPQGYDTSGITPVSIPERTCYYDNRDDAGNTVNCVLNNNINPSTGRKLLSASGYRVIDWCATTRPSLDGEGTCALGNRLSLGANINDSSNHGSFRERFNKDHELTLYPIWVFNNETITVQATWGPGRVGGSSSYPDFDTFIYGEKSNGTTFTAKWNEQIGRDIDDTPIAQLDHDCITDCGDEKFIINTLGGKNYYYYILNRNGSFASTNNLTINISGPYLGNYTLQSKDATGSNGSNDTGRYWNVFAYKDGEIYIENTITNRPDTSY